MRFGRGHGEPEPPEPVFDEDKDLGEVWPEVVRQYEKTTKRKLDATTTFKGFQLQIDTDIKDSKAKSHQHARTVLNNVGDCVEKFGCIVAQGASVVFGPSAQCWNAISFVIQAVRGFSDMMDGFVTLMERASAFMRRLVRFMEKEIGKGETHLPHLLRKPAYEILAQFLGVLRSSYKLATSTRERVKRMAGIVLFNSDNEVAETLELMEGHIKDFTRAEIDEILLGVGGLAKHLDKSDEERARYQSEILEYVQTTCKVGDQVLSVTQQIKATLDGRASKEQHEKNLEKLAAHLGPKKAGDWETWSKRHSELCKAHVEGTGEWLSGEETEYIKWSDLDQYDRQILFLQADSGFGKTHLFSHVVSHLEKKCRGARGPNKAYLAYYYYGDDKDDSLERCIGSIIYQFAAADSGYAQAVVDECGRLTGIARAEDRWNNLVSGLQHAMKGAYFICMDGFDGRGQLDTVEAMISTIACQAASSAKSNGISLRLFVSGNEDALSDISQRISSIHTIVLGQHGNLARPTEGAGDDPEITSPSKALPNASDLKAVTRARIKEVCRTKPGLKAILSEENIELLLEGIRGNYKNLEAKITEINACDTKGKVQNVINNTSADMDLVQRNRVKTLNALLSSGQAQVLNELLVWVAGLSYQPSTKLLESVLFLTSGEEFLLADQIATTYSPVLSISKEGDVGFKDGLRDILSASGTSDSESALTQLHDEAISAAEVNLCRRFIKNACDSTDYARFRFADFFDAMEQKVHIRLDDDNSVNVTIIDLCVRSLFDSRKDENLDELRDYASKWFYWHLKTLIEALDNFEPSRKFMNDVGARLVDLIYEPCMIDSWFAKKHLWWLKSDFLCQEDFIDPLLKFLKNPQVAKGYAKDAKKSAWAKSVVSNTANKYSILERVVARLASHWFSCRNGTMDTDYLWIPYGVFAKMSKPDEPFNEISPSLAEADRYIRWAKEHIDIDPDSFTWEFRVGATHVVFQHHKEAIAGLEKVEKHFQNNWALLYNLASAHESDKNHCSALKYIQEFKSLSGLFLETDETYKAVYYELLLSEGNCHRQRRDYDLAVKSFQDLLGREIDEESGMRYLYLDALSGLFTIWSEMKSYESIIDFVRNWKNATAENRGPTYWLRRAAYDDVSHTSIIVAAKNAGVVEEVLALYQEAIDYKPLDPSTVDQQDINVSAEATEQLQYFQAVLRFHGSKSSHDQHRSIQYWEEIIQRSDANPALHFTAYTASRKLAPTLLDKAVAELSTAPSSSSESFVGRLEKFANMNTTVVCNLHQGYLDPRLCLARLYFLRKDHVQAFKQAQARLCAVFDKWPEATDDNSLSLRFSNLAQTLTVLDADTDAVAAWQAIEPYQPSQVSVADAQVPGTGGPTKTSDEASHTNGVPASTEKESKDEPDDSSSTTAKTKAYISGYICDGGCGTEWENVLADCHVCKHCLCRQFCSACYKKLLAGDLHPLICNKDHKMLFLPPFDWDSWRTMPADMMTVGKQLVPRREWVDRIRKEYDVLQEQIDMTKLEKARELKAASVIAVRWRSRLKRIRDKNPSIAPTLRRVKTVG